MNWLKTLWKKLINKTSISPTLVVVETENYEQSEKETSTQILVRILLSRGLNMREISVMKIEPLFEEWYSGPATEQAVLESLPGFQKAFSMVFASDK